MARWRLSIGAMMGLVLGLGLASHLGITAWRVHHGAGSWKNLHVHTAVIENPGPGWFLAMERAPFWPAYWRALLGRSWQDWPLDRPVCRPAEGVLLEEWCELAHPRVRTDVEPNKKSMVQTKEQKDLYLQLAREKGLDVGLDKDGNVVHYSSRRKNADKKP